MSNARIGWEKNIDTAALKADTQVGSLPVGNMKQGDVARIWRAKDNDTYIVADFGQDINIAGTMLAGTNLTSNATRRVRVSTESSGNSASGDAHDSGTANANMSSTGLFGYLLPETVSGRYLRVDLADSSISRIEAGRWWAGDFLTPDTGVSFGFSKSWVENTQRSETPGGQTHVDRGRQRRTQNPEFSFLNDSEANEFDALIRDIGLFSDLWFVWTLDNTTISRDSLWGMLRDTFSTSRPDVVRSRVRLSLIERK